MFDKSVITTISMPLSLYRELRAKATEKNESISEFVRWSIIKELQDTKLTNRGRWTEDEGTQR